MGWGVGGVGGAPWVTKLSGSADTCFLNLTFRSDSGSKRVSLTILLQFYTFLEKCRLILAHKTNNTQLGDHTSLTSVLIVNSDIVA